MNNDQLTVYLKGNAGFALGGPAKTIPQEFANDYKRGNMDKVTPSTFNRVTNLLDKGRLMNGAPAYAHITQAGTLILE